VALRAYGDGSLFGEQTGERPRVMALPGWMRTRGDFTAALAGLDAIVVDLPGFGGASPPPPEAWGAAEYAAACEPVLAELTAPAVVVGHSFGGRVAVHLAAARKDAVGGLVLTGVPLLRRAGAPTSPRLVLRLARGAHRLGILPESVVERQRQRFGSADYRAAQGVMRDVLVRVVNETYEDQLAAIDQPVELVWGDSDTAVPPEVANRAEGLLAHSRLTIAGHVGHLLPTEAPGVLRAAIDRQLARLATP
jgi:pimeloyl-ACP methyl ester carboxylesterase